MRSMTLISMVLTQFSRNIPSSDPVRNGRKHITWWRHHIETFSALLPFVRGIHRSTVNSPHKGQWRGALMFSLISVWINDWVNTREAGDLRRYRVHCDVIVMKFMLRPNSSGYSDKWIPPWTELRRSVALSLFHQKILLWIMNRHRTQIDVNIIWETTIKKWNNYKSFRSKYLPGKFIYKHPCSTPLTNMIPWKWLYFKMSISKCGPYCSDLLDDDVIKWKHFPRNWPFVRGIHRSLVNSPHKGQ